MSNLSFFYHEVSVGQQIIMHLHNLKNVIENSHFKDISGRGASLKDKMTTNKYFYFLDHPFNNNDEIEGDNSLYISWTNDS